jgi:membrane protease YdiL (CAAX protease family)
MLIFLSLAQGFAGKVTFTGGRWTSLVNFVLAGLILGFVEEVLFRGIVLRLFYSAFRSPLVAAVLSALLFAYTHFKAPVGGHVGQVLWNSAVPVGMQTVWGIFQSFDCVLFMNLFGLGLFLNLLFLRKRTLIPCIAFHAGIVFSMLAYKRFFRIEVINWKAFFGSNRVTDAWFVFVVWVIGISVLMFKLGKDGREKVELA